MDCFRSTCTIFINPQKFCFFNLRVTANPDVFCTCLIWCTQREVSLSSMSPFETTACCSRFLSVILSVMFFQPIELSFHSPIFVQKLWFVFPALSHAFKKNISHELDYTKKREKLTLTSFCHHAWSKSKLKNFHIESRQNKKSESLRSTYLLLLFGFLHVSLIQCISFYFHPAPVVQVTECSP